jgi:hypothetical protein
MELGLSGLNKFSQATKEHVFGQLYRWLFEQIAMVRLTLDLDSTVITRYGVQEGAAKRYNPRRKGRLLSQTHKH